MESIVLTEFKIREIDDLNIEYLIPIDAVIKLITPQDYLIDTVEDNRVEKEGIFYVITQQEYGGLTSRSRVIKADKEGWVHIIFNSSIHKMNIETMVKTGIPSRGVIDQLRYVLVAFGDFMEDPVRLHSRIIELLKEKIRKI